MAITLSTGTVVAVASTYGTAVNMTAITNAASAVATLASGHSVVVGDFLEVTSGWDLLSGRIVRVSNVATNDITFEGINTTDTTLYPAGSGTGTIRRITAWTNVTQIRNIAPGGGEQNFVDVTTIVDRVQKQIPTTRSPQTLQLTVLDDPALSWYTVVNGAAELAKPTALRLVFPNNSRLVANGYWSLQTTPNVAANEPLTANIDISFSATPTRYST
jgi:hypothetical protein